MTATHLKLGLGALVIAGIVAAFVIQQQAQTRLANENQALQRQLAQLQNDNTDLSNRLAASTNANQLSSDQFNELLRLRGENGLLRRQAGQAAQLQSDNQQLQTKLAGAPSAPPQLSPDDQFQLHQMHMVNAMKQMGLAMRIYEGDHNDQLPTNIDQITNYLGDAINGFKFTYVAGVPDVIGLDNFELMNVGQVNDSMPQALMIREQNARQNPNGGWSRAYAFADGSVQSEYSSDENFDNFEAQHSVTAQVGNQ